MKRNFDVVFVGGGLAAGLTAFRLIQKKPDLNLLIVEKGATLGGNHTWSFHETDLTLDQHTWIAPLISRSWLAYDVAFPNFHRTMNSPYYSIRSNRFHEVLTRETKIRIELNRWVREMTPNSVTLDDGVVVQATCVIDTRGWEDGWDVPVAYQKFFGVDVTLHQPHGLTRPVLMDATQMQKDGFRFFYVLPWSENQLLIEDTRYSDVSSLDQDEYRSEILAYAKNRGWKFAFIDREEIGVLSIPLGGGLPSWLDGIPRAGTRAGLFHATTGYSLPPAARFAEAFSALGTFEPETVFSWTADYAKRHWKKQSFFRILNRMLFQAAPAEERYKVLEKFYRRPEDLVGRFYAGELHGFDWLRIFSGRPPVPLVKAVPCIFKKRKVAR